MMSDAEGSKDYQAILKQLEPLRSRKLFVATPFYLCTTWLQYTLSLVNLMMTLRNLDLAAEFKPLPGDSYIDRARNSILSMFLSSDATDLLFIDSDMGFKPGTVLKLWLADKPIVGCAYPVKNAWDQFTTRLAEDAEGFTIHDGPLIRADMLSGGFIRFTREAVEKLWEAEKGREYKDCQGRVCRPVFEHGERDNGYWGEDYWLSKKWEALGGELWLEPDADLVHVGMKEFKGNFAEHFLRLREEAMRQVA